MREIMMTLFVLVTMSGCALTSKSVIDVADGRKSESIEVGVKPMGITPSSPCPAGLIQIGTHNGTPICDDPRARHLEERLAQTEHELQQVKRDNAVILEAIFSAQQGVPVPSYQAQPIQPATTVVVGSELEQMRQQIEELEETNQTILQGFMTE